MPKFEVLPHVADLKLKAFGKTKEELFENSMLGMFEGAGIVAEKSETKIEREIEIKSVDTLSLLVDFLSELLYLSEINDEVYQRVEFKELKAAELEAAIEGNKIKERKTIIKGVTYHSLEIFKNKKGLWEATILFDI